MAIVDSNASNCGLAEAFKTEIKKFLELKFDVFVHIDADGQYKAEEIPLLLKEIDKGCDLVLGSRFMGKIEYMPFMKRLGNKIFSKVISQVSRFKISDAQTGFRAFTRKVAEEIDIISTFTYTQEQIIKAARMKFKIKEVPVTFLKRGGETKSRLMKNPFDYAVKAWINILRIYRDYEPLKFFGLFGGTIFLLGIVVGLWILYWFFITGSVGGLPRVLLSVLLISIGLQIILFGFLADMIKK